MMSDVTGVRVCEQVNSCCRSSLWSMATCAEPTRSSMKLFSFHTCRCNHAYIRARDSQRQVLRAVHCG
jgi:hypothetical protein